jgi:SAM-dependent methyltransferase
MPENRTLAPEAIQKLLKDPSRAAVRDGKLFLIEPPEGIHVDTRPAKLSNRSKSRTYDFEFYKKELEGKSGVMLDVGAGSGLFREIFSTFEYIGLDLFPYDVVNIVADVRTGLPFKDGSIDIVMLSNVLEHTPDPWLLVREAARVVKKGSMLIGTVPFIAHEHQEPEDYLRYTHFMLERLFRDSGFDARVVPLETALDLLEWAHRQVFDQVIYREGKKGVHEKIAYYLTKAAIRFAAPVLATSKTTKITRRFGFVAYKT